MVARRCARKDERERNRTSLFQLVRFDEVPGLDTWFVFEVPGLDTLNYYSFFRSSFSNSGFKFFESSSSSSSQVFRIKFISKLFRSSFSNSSSSHLIRVHIQVFVQVFRIQVSSFSNQVHLLVVHLKFSFKFFVQVRKIVAQVRKIVAQPPKHKFAK